MAPQQHSASRYRLGNWTLDAATHRLTCDGTEHPLDPKQLSVLLHLAEHARELVTTDELLERTWPGVVVGDNAIHQVIGRLRKALGDDARKPRYIETMSRCGYRLLVPLAPCGDDASPHSAADSTPDPGRKRQYSSHRVAIGLGIVVAALVTTVMLWHGERSAGTASAGTATVIVQPFVSRSGETADTHLAASFRDEIAQRLGRIAAFRVFSGETATPRAGPDATHALAGTLYGRVDGSYELSVRLLRPESGRLLWSESYDIAAGTVSGMRKVVASRVAQALYLMQNPTVQQLRVRYPDTDPGAWHAFLKARVTGGTGDPERIDEILSLFQQALQLDPGFAPAHAGKGWAYYHLGHNGGIGMADAVAEARAEAHRALELDPELASALVLAAWISLYDGDFAAADAAIRQASWDEVDYLRTQVYFYYAICGRFDEALAAADRAIIGNPVPLAMLTDKAQILWYMKRFAEGLAVIEEVRSVRPDYWKAAVVHYWLLRSLERDAAAEALLASSVLRRVRVSHAPAGKQSFDLALAHAIARGETPIPASFAWRYYVPAYAGTGEPELAVEWLKAGYEQGDRIEVLYRRIDQNRGMDAMRRHPAYQRFVEESFGHPPTCPG